MTAQNPDAGGPPDEHDATPSVPEDVWERFLTDTEHAIRTTAPKEPPASLRTPMASPESRVHAGSSRTGAGRTDADRADPGLVAVGDLWRPDDPWAGPSWRDLDRPARLRRAGRVVGTAAAIVLALGAYAQLSGGAGTPAEGPGDDTVLRQSEVAPADLPTATSGSPRFTSPYPSDPAVQAG